jgi:3-oxoacyl-[acyl-carrier protein] reductase
MLDYSTIVSTGSDNFGDPDERLRALGLGRSAVAGLWPGHQLLIDPYRLASPRTDHLRRTRPNTTEADMTNVQQNGRVALVTGASRGIGAAVARLLASRGMRVVVNYRSSSDEADEVVGSIRSAGGQAMAAQADVRDGLAVQGMVEQVQSAMGEVEVLVHNALIPYDIKPFAEMSWDELGGKLDQEMRATFLLTKAVVPGMTSRGYGRIVYMGTGLSRQPREGMIALGTSKAAVGSFARFVAQELGPRGITVNVVAPGPVAETNIHKAVLDEVQARRQAEETALGRLASPDDVARAVAFYAGDDSEFITGTTAPVNGGMAMD